jgi:hypothetical protein
VTIRRAEAADLATLSSLGRQTYVDAFGHSFSREDLAAHLATDLADSYFHRALAPMTRT